MGFGLFGSGGTDSRTTTSTTTSTSSDDDIIDRRIATEGDVIQVESGGQLSIESSGEALSLVRDAIGLAGAANASIAQGAAAQSAAAAELGRASIAERDGAGIGKLLAIGGAAVAAVLAFRGKLT